MARDFRIGGVVLAAGRSARMAPANKLLRDFGGRPLVHLAAQTAADAGLAPIVAVTGHSAGQVGAALAGLPLELVHNPDYAAGLASSVRAGVHALGTRADAALFLLADMPLITAAHLRRLMQAFAAAPEAAACVPSFQSRRGNPVLWSAACFPQLAALEGDQGARALFRQFAARIVEVAMPDDAVLVDIDTEAALQAAQARLPA